MRRRWEQGPCKKSEGAQWWQKTSQAEFHWTIVGVKLGFQSSLFFNFLCRTEEHSSHEKGFS